MQLVIPIEDTSSGSNNSNHCIDKQHRHGPASETRSASDSLERNSSNVSAVLSDDLRDQFEAMKSVWRQARRGGEDLDYSSFNGSNENSEQRENVHAELKRKERETAIETAIKMEREMALWQEGIADLEALLAAEDEQESIEETSIEVDEQRKRGEENIPLGIREVVFVNRRHAKASDEIGSPFLPPPFP
mmetsp:Transcript_16267/g.37467  ORF Transcript_16267/g.37467 Transcript_16267/m.37467 type:complete len:190 (-) Transcript_16267:263-832(-)|eukprot:CAMPEP_0172410322 /NCGR_PEP_ID=MMETSP1061-20121228/76816_1 /TAXON_ID=37318 /ORGANISM="Pseudo-nitzschia pungens, Strain cf. pungens" /LENGTH=189 /DNA_ID=CAMNT_0013146497 /DNA_START=962 /DNA_END=1531 /DNA_ORIENTATION=+